MSNQKKIPNPEKPRIAIIGLGPVGIILAVHLQEAGCEIAVCDNDKIKINLIRKEGVKLEGVINKQCFFKNVYTDIGDLKEFGPEIIVTSLKTYQTKSVLPLLAGLQHDNLTFISAQNGIDVEHILSGAFGESKVLRMIINFAGNLNAPNIVKVTFFTPPNYLASIDDSRTEVAELFAASLNKMDLHTKVITSFELLRRSWEKTILNSSLSALCGIGKMTMKEAMDMPNTMEVIEQVIQEAVEVAAAEKIKFEDDFIRKCMRYLKKAGDHFPSLAVDLINNRPTEIDYFNGKIVEYGRKHYIRTSLNLVFTNMVRAMTHKSFAASIAGDASLVKLKGNGSKKAPASSGPCFLGVDLGSAFTKFTVIDAAENVVFQSTHRTLNRERIAMSHVSQAIREEFNIAYSCATGYGRKSFSDSDIVKTEIYSAAKGVSKYFSGAKSIIDIGGEDIKTIHCDEQNQVENFYLNDKCAAGTGSFIVEVAERADIPIGEMSNLASKSNFGKELNSFCTVFAKTEIMKWMFEGIPVEDTAKGIYLSIANKVAKMRLAPDVPVFMIGGVIAYHPYLKTILETRLKNPIQIIEKPQHVVSFGAALLAKEHFEHLTSNEEPKESLKVIETPETQIIKVL
ncbi:MAG: 2-dehydropantoate 2-reductase [Saprospiraceae bacterium]|nr:2-dehydropantoate 2-reductase [Saprospiraceae bacterium]MCF8249010.1 2-dehydropantoate 2-reductase [Saprospiraceae bacterium]MCF8310904.1 2-dehydropantoate 2-reductase [Saprospiraceae bacterium]MCF8439508.1 2-dehydropantoate 2-reductase [Saprospiraceae bacterium]